MFDDFLFFCKKQKRPLSTNWSCLEWLKDWSNWFYFYLFFFFAFFFPSPTCAFFFLLKIGGEKKTNCFGVTEGGIKQTGRVYGGSGAFRFLLSFPWWILFFIEIKINFCFWVGREHKTLCIIFVGKHGSLVAQLPCMCVLCFSYRTLFVFCCFLVWSSGKIKRKRASVDRSFLRF